MPPRDRPNPKPSPPPRSEGPELRQIPCANEDRCLTYVIHQRWRGFHCLSCAATCLPSYGMGDRAYVEWQEQASKNLILTILAPDPSMDSE